MAQAQKGDSVKINFTGKLDDGSIFAGTADDEPLEFKLGEGRILTGIENAVVGMDVGETKSVTVPPEEGFGQRRAELIQEVGREDLPKGIDPKVGQRFQIPQPQGQPMELMVVEVTQETVTLDGNHPLADKELTFDLELVEIL